MSLFISQLKQLSKDDLLWVIEPFFDQLKANNIECIISFRSNKSKRNVFLYASKEFETITINTLTKMNSLKDDKN